jgi:hypothetical protein
MRPVCIASSSSPFAGYAHTSSPIQGLRLEKSRRRDPHALDYGKFILIDVATNGVVLGSGPVGPNADLEDVERYLKGER